jgi:hypothetical protein
MVQNLSDAAVQQCLLGAEAAGDLCLVDEHARPIALLDSLDQRCWAHLRDAADGQLYVHELPGSLALQAARYLGLLGINV